MTTTTTMRITSCARVLFNVLQQLMHRERWKYYILHILLHFTYFSIVSQLWIHLDDSFLFLCASVPFFFHVSMCFLFHVHFRFSSNQNKCFSLQWKCIAIPFTFSVVIFARNRKKGKLSRARTHRHEHLWQ